MAVGIIIAIVIVVIIVLCVRQAVKGLQEAKQRAMSKLGALMKRDESLELLNATPDTELETVQPASSDKKKLVRNLLRSEQLLTPTSSPGLFPQKMGGAPHPCFEGKALGTSLLLTHAPLKKREENWSRNVSRNCFWDRYWGRVRQLLGTLKGTSTLTTE